MGLVSISLFLACAGALVVRNLVIADAFTEHAADEQRRKDAELPP